MGCLCFLSNYSGCDRRIKLTCYFDEVILCFLDWKSQSQVEQAAISICLVGEKILFLDLNTADGIG